MRYAIIQTGGKQYKVSEGDMIEIELLKGIEAQGAVAFDQVLLMAGDGKVEVGTPYLSGIAVHGVMQDQIVRGPKIRVMKYKAKVRHRRATGHRQKLSQVLIKSIGGAAVSEKKSVIKKTVEAKKPVSTKASK